MTNPRRLKPKEVAAYRKRLLAKQHGLCALCKLPIEPGQDTLDHDHATGHCRGVLHRNCNQLDGRILAWAKRAYCAPDDFLEAIVAYWRQDYSHYALHPNHRSEAEKEIRLLRKRMRHLKTERAIQRYKDRIAALKETL